jgi:hypothetical protein
MVLPTPTSSAIKSRGRSDWINLSTGRNWYGTKWIREAKSEYRLLVLG